MYNTIRPFDLAVTVLLIDVYCHFQVCMCLQVHLFITHLSRLLLNEGNQHVPQTAALYIIPQIQLLKLTAARKARELRKTYTTDYSPSVEENIIGTARLAIKI